MALPAGISTCTVTKSPPKDILGGSGTIVSATVHADRDLVWAATGETLYGVQPVALTPVGDGLSFPLIHVNQAGILDANTGQEVTNWFYTVTITVQYGGKRQGDEYRLQVVQGQSSLDLDLIERKGTVLPSVSAPLPAVTSVAGETGAVTADTMAMKVAPELVPTFIGKAQTVTFDIRDFGARVDGEEIADAAMTAGSAVLTSVSRPFVAGDVGKVVGVSGAGTVSGNYTTNANDGVLVGTISSVSAGAATLSVPAVNTVSGATAAFGTPDDDAFEAAQAAASAAHGTVLIPPGRSIVTRPLEFLSHVEWRGINRDVSWVEVIFSAPSTGPSEWLHKPTSDRRQAVHMHDFAVEARYHIRPSGYSTSLKPLNIWGVDRASIANMQLRNFPATAIPFDGCRDGVLIANNLVVNPGRLFDGSAGGSGIGIGVTRNGVPISYLVLGNTIIGVGSPTTAPKGNNGIFVEAQDGSTAPPIGVRIIGNYVQGFRKGIADNGCGHAVITDNVVIDCYEGITVNRGGVAGSYAGESPLIKGNVVTGWAPGSSVSKGILVYLSVAGDVGNARIIDNTVQGRTGRGIVLLADAGTTLDGVEVRGNRIKDCTLSGIFVDNFSTGAVADLAIIGNEIDNVGTTDTAGDDSGIRIAVPVARLVLCGNRVVAPNGGALAITDTVTAGLITGNDLSSVGITGTLTGVRVYGNLGWTAGQAGPLAVSGSRSGNAALASLITRLATLGIVTDSSSA